MSSKKGSLALIGAILLFLSDSKFMESPPEPYIVYCGTGLIGLAIVSQAVIDAIRLWKYGPETQSG